MPVSVFQMFLAATLAAALLSPQLAYAQDAETDPLFQKVAGRAADRAARDYRPPEKSVPRELEKLTYDAYRKIRFRKGQALWRGEALFEVQFFHPGFLYTEPVSVHVVEDGQEKPLAFDKTMFRYDGEPLTEDLPKDLGFAGFRIHYPLHGPDYKDELAVFLGASYFRLLAREQTFGMSARGLAIDTGAASGEEFPAFREFWLVKPAPGDTQMTVYALLDSPSATGAYRFTLHPGAPTRVDVRSQLFIRTPGKKIGIAPLTSMFLFGENRSRFFDDHRPEVHDSDGLLMQTAAGEWIWRPLVNPTSLRMSSLMDENPQGFGLLQRDRAYEHYLDPEARYERRPGFWIKPRGAGWGKGAVELLEIPTEEEIHDNIVAYWVPDETRLAGEGPVFEYSIFATSQMPPAHSLGRVQRTRIGWAAVPGQEDKPPRTARRFVIEFDEGELTSLGAQQPVEADLSATTGDISHVTVKKIEENDHWRVAFIFKPDAQRPSDMRLFLRLRDKTLTETWNYVWSSDALQ